MSRRQFMRTNEIDIEADGTIYNSLRDFGLAIGNTDYIREPVVDESNLVFVPGRAMPLDMSDDVFGGTIYKYREISIDFGGIRHPQDWDVTISHFRNLFEGKTVKIWFLTDPEWYWTGKARIESFLHKRALGEFTLRIPYADAYKQRERTVELQTAQQGTEIMFYNAGRKVIPTITTDAEIMIVCGTISVSLSAGTWRNTSLALPTGQTQWTITGSANVTIEYTERSL